MVNPHLDTVKRVGFRGYYWVVDQAEIATDVMFKDRASLAAVMPDLVHHASLNMSSADVMRFLGRKLHPSLKAEVVTDTKARPEGWRVKHRLARNWIKVYDQVSVLRVETVINNPREFRILRAFTDEKGRRERRWCEMNKGVANFWRYFQVGHPGQPALPRRTGRRPSQRQRCRRARRLVPEQNQRRASPRPLQPPQRIRPSPVSSRPRRRAHHRRLPQR
jgi:hypothetical protein